MKMMTIGTFATREDAEKAINKLHNDLDIPTDHISYVYKNTDGEVKEHDADDIARDTLGESTGKGAAVGGTLGAIAGLAVFAGMIPVVGPLLAAGPLAAALGFTGAAGAAVAGGAAGAVAGGLIAALGRLGLSSEHAQRYADRVEAGDILVAVHAELDKGASTVLAGYGAQNIETYTVAV